MIGYEGRYPYSLPPVPVPTLPINMVSPPPSILHLSFNQDYSCFAVGTERGFKVFRTSPLRLLFERGED